MPVVSKLYANEKTKLKNTLFLSHLPTSAYSNLEGMEANFLKLAVGPSKIVAGAGMVAYGAVMFWVPLATKFQRVTTLDANGVHDSTSVGLGLKSECAPLVNFRADFSADYHGVVAQDIDQINPYLGYDRNIYRIDPSETNFEYSLEGLEQRVFDFRLQLHSLNSQFTTFSTQPASKADVNNHPILDFVLADPAPVDPENVAVDPNSELTTEAKEYSASQDGTTTGTLIENVVADSNSELTTEAKEYTASQDGITTGTLIENVAADSNSELTAAPKEYSASLDGTTTGTLIENVAADSNSELTTEAKEYSASQYGTTTGTLILKLFSGGNRGIALKVKNPESDVKINAESTVELGGSNFVMAGTSMILDGAWDTALAVPKGVYYGIRCLRSKKQQPKFEEQPETAQQPTLHLNVT